MTTYNIERKDIELTVTLKCSVFFTRTTTIPETAYSPCEPGYKEVFNIRYDGAQLYNDLLKAFGEQDEDDA